jgi:hypothetical protein
MFVRCVLGVGIVAGAREPSECPYPPCGHHPPKPVLLKTERPTLRENSPVVPSAEELRPVAEIATA